MNSISRVTSALTKGMGAPGSPGKSYPKFCNDGGVAEIHIDVKQFECIGASSPHDHPHIYLDMGSDDAILCPYCATRFRYDLAPGGLGADPSNHFVSGAASYAVFGAPTVGEDTRPGVRAAFDAAVSEGWPAEITGSHGLTLIDDRDKMIVTI